VALARVSDHGQTIRRPQRFCNWIAARLNVQVNEGRIREPKGHIGRRIADHLASLNAKERQCSGTRPSA
jgi:hypothetical protein